MKRKGEDVRKDAKPQYIRTRKGASNSGVSSAMPQVITGREDATFDTDPEGGGEN